MTDLHIMTQIFENAGHKVKITSDNYSYVLYIDNYFGEPQMLVFDRAGHFLYIH